MIETLCESLPCERARHTAILQDCYNNRSKAKAKIETIERYHLYLSRALAELNYELSSDKIIPKTAGEAPAPNALTQHLLLPLLNRLEQQLVDGV